MTVTYFLRWLAGAWMVPCPFHLMAVLCLSMVCPWGRVAGEPLHTFKYDPSLMAIVVPVEIEDESYSFVLDIGTTLTIFDKSLREKLNGPIATREVTTSLSTFSTGLFIPPRTTIGGLPFNDIPVYCLDLAIVRRLCRRPIAGILGMDFLHRYIVQIDPDSAEVRLLQPDAIPRLAWGEALPLNLRHGSPQISVSVNGTEHAWFLVTCGATTLSTISYADLVPRYIAQEDRWQVTGWGWFVGLEQEPDARDKQVILRAKSLRMGGFVHADIVLSTGNRSALGLPYLTRYCSTFDFPRGQLYLRPSKYFGIYDRTNLDGMSIDTDEAGRHVVTFVNPDTPAARAGIQKGDVIVALDGIPVSQHPRAWVVHYLTFVVNRDVTIGIERAEERVAIVLPAGPPSATVPAANDE